MIPACCICGKAANHYHDPEWKWQDFCPECGSKIEKKYGELKQYCIFFEVKEINQ